MTKFLVDKMPVDCVECPVCDGDRGICNISGDYTEFEWGERPTNCPLEEVKHGKWKQSEIMQECFDIGGDKTWGIKFMCESCGFKTIAIEGDFAQYNYCPQCGADMRGEE